MKYLLILLIPIVAIADQRIETTDGFCHFVTPQGFGTNNADAEVFAAGCQNSSIHQNSDGTATGSTIHKIKYPATAYPFEGEYEYNGADTQIDCVMVDSNGTTYATRDWTAKYKSVVKDLDEFKEAYGTSDPEYDYNEDGIVNFSDMAIFKQKAKGEVKYSLTCRNGAQQ